MVVTGFPTAALTGIWHGAGAALPFSAAVLAAGEAKLVAQDIEQRSFRIVMDGIALAVHFNFDFIGHNGSLQRRHNDSQVDRVSLKVSAQKSGSVKHKQLLMRDAHAPDRFGLGRAEFTQSWITGLTRG
jgi:hypothetical protein